MGSPLASVPQRGSGAVVSQWKMRLSNAGLSTLHAPLVTTNGSSRRSERRRAPAAGSGEKKEGEVDGALRGSGIT
jgi:hypothetical protein